MIVAPLKRVCVLWTPKASNTNYNRKNKKGGVENPPVDFYLVIMNAELRGPLSVPRFL
jgi:hypothetical protein